jgi:hypothetical protein
VERLEARREVEAEWERILEVGGMRLEAEGGRVEGRS